MKLEKFIENYQKKNIVTPASRSPQRQHLFRTSQSIGTLNSYDQFVTDRSFVVKQHTFMVHPDSQSVEHLKQLCAASSRYPSRKASEQRLMQELITQNSGQKHAKIRDSAPYFNKEQEKAMNSFAKNKTKIMQNMHEISFEAHTQGDQGFLYEQQPSNIYEGYPTETTTLTNETLQFIEQYDALSLKMTQLQQQNNILELQFDKSTELSQKLQQQEEALEFENKVLHEQVAETIQQTIELENKIKQLLLRHELEKHQYVSTRQALTPISVGNKNKTPHQKMQKQ